MSNTIKITAVSEFHGPALAQTFRVPAEEGTYRRNCPRACDGKCENGVQVHCGCGWPVARTTWIAPDGWCAYAEWAESWDGPGGNIKVRIWRDPTATEGE